MSEAESPGLQEYTRALAVRRLEEGDTQEEVAAFFGVSARTVQRWWHAWRDGGEAGLAPRAGRGRAAGGPAS